LGDELAVLCSEPLGLVDRKTLTLWDEVAISDFVAFWAKRRRSAAQEVGSACAPETNSSPSQPHFAPGENVLV
jgi:hypothetical protein